MKSVMLPHFQCGFLEGLPDLVLKTPDGRIFREGLLNIWMSIRSDLSMEFHCKGLPLVKEWLGHPGGRYADCYEDMFQDFLETLRMIDVADSSTKKPLDDPKFAQAFTQHWVPYDPEMRELPASVRERLLPLSTDRIRNRNMDELAMNWSMWGLCFFITEDDRMGLCPAGTLAGDTVVALFGGAVPYVLHQRKDDHGEEAPENEQEHEPREAQDTGERHAMVHVITIPNTAKKGKAAKPKGKGAQTILQATRRLMTSRTSQKIAKKLRKVRAGRRMYVSLVDVGNEIED